MQSPAQQDLSAARANIERNTLIMDRAYQRGHAQLLVETLIHTFKLKRFVDGKLKRFPEPKLRRAYQNAKPRRRRS